MGLVTRHFSRRSAKSVADADRRRSDLIRASEEIMDAAPTTVASLSLPRAARALVKSVSWLVRWTRSDSRRE